MLKKHKHAYYVVEPWIVEGRRDWQRSIRTCLMTSLPRIIRVTFHTRTRAQGEGIRSSLGAIDGLEERTGISCFGVSTILDVVEALIHY